MAVVGCTLLLTMHLTLRTVDVQDNTPVDCLGHTTFYPFDIQPLEALEVILLSKQLGLEPAYLDCAGRVPVWAFSLYHHSHGRVLGEAVGVIGVIVPCEAAVD
jgi:hypothetical protein